MTDRHSRLLFLLAGREYGATALPQPPAPRPSNRVWRCTHALRSIDGLVLPPRRSGIATKGVDVVYALWLTGRMTTADQTSSQTLPDATQVAKDAQAVAAALSAADLDGAVTSTFTAWGVSISATGTTMIEMGRNADSAEIACREAGVPVKRFSVSTMYVLVDPAKRQAMLDSPMPVRGW